MSSDSEGTTESATGGSGGSILPINTATRLVVVLLAVLLGAGTAAGVLFMRGSFSENSPGSSTIGEGNYEQNDFTRSQAGDCLNWPDNAAGQPSKVACTDKHRFEVAGALDTANFPGVEFSSAAQWPGPDRFAQIRDEQCESVVNGYLGAGLDPQGRFSIGMMYPSQDQWDRGARVLRCGVEQPGPEGRQEEFTGRAADSDQSFAWPVGSCVGIDPKTRKPTTQVVNCAEPHAFQTTGVVDLSQRFGPRNSGRPWPTVEDQNKYLRTICPNQTNQFFKGEKNFKKTTLNVQWSVISEVSWMTGSRRVVCYVALPDRGGFARLVGDARQQLLINGKLPAPEPEGPPGRQLPTPIPGSGDDSGIEVPAPN